MSDATNDLLEYGAALDNAVREFLAYIDTTNEGGENEGYIDTDTVLGFAVILREIVDARGKIDAD
jgi:hypothetical protein